MRSSEPLVGVALIAILAAFLFPIFAKLREKGGTPYVIWAVLALIGICAIWGLLDWLLNRGKDERFVYYFSKEDMFVIYYFPDRFSRQVDHVSHEELASQLLSPPEGKKLIKLLDEKKRKYESTDPAAITEYLKKGGMLTAVFK